MAYTFILSDESVNSYGFRVMISGLDLTRFKNNPVMFYMHERESGIIGRWENIRITGAKLLADAVFDESNPLGKEVKAKVDKGFIRSASIGLEEPIVREVIDGIETVTSCGLKEASIVDVPANMNAVRLYNQKGKCVYNLADLQPMEPEEFARVLMELLELGNDADEHDVLNKIRELKEKAGDPDEINKALKHGFISEGEHNLLMKMKPTNPGYISTFLKDKMTGCEAVIEEEVNKANKAGKIIYYDRALYKTIGLEVGLKTLRKLFNAMPTQLKITDIIDGGKDSIRAKWGLNEYRKYAPQELKDNPELYKALVDREKGDPLPEFGLDYYRKHNPQYLKDNPGEYQKMIAKQSKNQ